MLSTTPEDKLVVLGQGYVGLPMALRAASAGLHAVGLDVSAATVANLNAGRSHIGDVSDDDLKHGLSQGYRASTDFSEIATAAVVLVCVPTPLADEGGPDLSAVRAAAKVIGEFVSPSTLVVLESTTYPGTTHEVFAPLVSTGGLEIGRDLFVAFSPERIDPGNATWHAQNTPKVVGGITPECTRRAVAFYERFIDTVVPAKGVMEAEMSKLIENTFRHVNIALVNEMLRFSHDLGIDIWDAIDCAETKPFGFMAFRPGPGVGGHCIPVDPTYLSHRVRARLGYSFRLVELAEEINTAAPLYVAARARDLLNDRKIAVNGARVLLLGATYKADVADQRESPADPIARRLVAWGADLSYHDPYVARWSPVAGREPMTSVEDLDHELATSDLVILLQPHSSYDASLLRRAEHLLDTRGVVDGDPAKVTRL